MLTLSYSKIKKYAFCALAIPFIVFAIGWLKWYWAVVTVAATLGCLWLGVFARGKKNDGDKVISMAEAEKTITIKKWIFVVVMAIAFIWVWQSGVGGFWAQSKDYPWRNAIYRDIVLRDWPVFYELYGGALVYYIGFWLPPALLGKVALLLGASDVVAFQVASVAIYVWSAALIAILFCLLLTLLKADTTKKQILVILGFVFFSGLDILGSIEPLGANLYHLEWWANDYQYSSFTTCLFWVFNQSIIPWIAMACLLQENSIRNYVFLGMMCLFSGPLPFVGFFIFCITLGVLKGVESIRNKKTASFFKDIVSLSNILATVFIFIFIATYLLTNAVISNGGGLRVSEDGAIIQTEASETDTTAEQQQTSAVQYDALVQYLMFVMFEFGFYALLIARRYYKQPMFYVMVISLLVFPFLKMGGSLDFPMRASIPALFYLYYLVMEFLLKEHHWMQKKEAIQRTLYLVLVVALVLGSVTPLVEFYRGCRQVVKYGLDNPMEDYLYTLGGDGPNGWTVESGYEYSNFVSMNSDEQLFFQIFAKDLQK